MKKTIRTMFTASLNETEGEWNELPSETIPDESLSVRQIMDRYARGLPLSGQHQVEDYDEDNDLPDPRTLDLAEREHYKEAFWNEIQQIQDQRLKNEKEIQYTPTPPPPSEEEETH